MELCVAFSLLAIGLLVFAAVGHGVWLVFAVVFRALSGQPSPDPVPPARSGRRACARCGKWFSRRAAECPSCGLDPRGAVAIELHELEITTRHIQALVEKDALEPAAGEQIYRLIEARQTALLEDKPVMAAVPAAPPAADVPPYQAVPVTEEPLGQQLERLLGTCQDVRNLTVAHRKQALAWYRQLAEFRHLNGLSAPGLFKLARLLRSAALITRPLDVYQLLLETFPNEPEALQAGREAARFAAAESLPERARWFLTWLLPRSANEEERKEILELLHDLPQTGEGERAEPFPDETAAPAAAEAPAPPRRSVGELLAGFMEERNILWGELVGGLLIVGCSIALVISLWQTLEQIPYFPFLILAAITAALFGSGHYTLSHWKLESTSRGLLVIATLLTPLDFLVVAGLSRGQQAGWLDLAIEIGSLAAFTALVLPSARTLVHALPAVAGKPAWWLTLAVLGSAGSQLLVPRYVAAADTSGWFLPLGFVPVVCQALAVGAVLLALARRDRLEGDTANALFLFLGQATFTVAVALGFLVYWNGDTLDALRHLAMPIAVAGMPVLIGGALVHRLLEGSAPEPAGAESSRRGLSPAVARLVGTFTTLTGMLVMLGALVLTWPRPEGLMVIGAVNAAAFTVAALRYRLPLLHAPALACLAVLSLTAYHGLLGNLAAEETGRHLLTLAGSAQSGSLLAVLAVILAATAEFVVRVGRRVDGLYHLVGAGVAAILALLLVSREGAAVPERAALAFTLCGAGGLVVNLRWRQPWLSYLGSLVLLGAIEYALLWGNPNMPLPRLALLALLIEATWLLGLGLGLAPMAAKSAFVLPFQRAGLVASVLAVLPLALAVQWSWLTGCCLCTLWLAALWLIIAWVKRVPPLFQAFQAALTAAVLFGVTPRLDDVWALFLPRRVQDYFLALAVLGLAWVVLRGAALARPRVNSLLETSWGAVDRIVFTALVLGQLLLAVAVVLPEVIREYVPLPELGPRNALATFDLTSAWTLLGVLGLALAVALWNHRPHEAVLGGVLLGLTVPVLLGYGFREELAAGSALRWGLALAFVGYSGLLWSRRPLWRGCGRLGIWWTTPLNVPRWVRALLLAGALLPVLLLTWWIAAIGFSGGQPVGPAAGSVFARMGWTASAVGPLVLLALGLVGHGLREDSAGYVFGAGLLVAVTAMGGYALGVVTGGGMIDAAEGVFIAHLGILCVAVWGLAWLASGRWRNLFLLRLQVFLGFFGNIGLYLPALVLVVVGTDAASEEREFIIAAGQWTGWLGLLGTVALGVWFALVSGRGGAVHVLGMGGILLGILSACTAAAWDADGWLAYHTLTLVRASVGFALVVGGWAGASLRRIGPGFWSEERRTRAATLLGRLLPARPTRYWVEEYCVAVVLLALGGATADPARPYWSCAAALAAGVLLGADAVWSRRPGLVYASGLMLNVVGYLVWQSWRAAVGEEWDVAAQEPDLFQHFVFLQIICLGVASACWSLLEWKLRRLATPIDLRGRAVPFAHAAALGAVHLLALVVFVGLLGDLTSTHIHLAGPLAWAALAASLVAVILCFWDPEATHWGLPVAPLYVTGLLALGLALHGLDLPPRELAWTATPLLGGYLTATAAAVWLVPRGNRLWRRLRVPARVDSGLIPWFLPGQALLGLLVLGLGMWICLDFATMAQRLIGPAATALLAAMTFLLTVCRPALLSTASPPADGAALRQCTLVLCFLAALESAWAWLGDDVLVLWLHRNVQLLAVLIVFAALYGSRLAGRLVRESAWAVSARRLAEGMAVLALTVLGIVLVQEFFLYDPVARRVPLAWPDATLVGVLLAAVLVGGLWVALNPRRDPFGLSERGRMGAVYGAEVFLVLLLLHLRLNVSDLFPGFLGRNWALVVMTLGFVGVGLAELFQRRGLPVLAKPLQQTGLFLPLLPLLAFLLKPLGELHALGEAVPGFQPLLRYLSLLPAHYGTHALLWFLLGLLYALVAVLRRSSAFALLGALAVNFGLWVIYFHVEGLGFALHPQLWLIPVGLIVLAAEHLNRSRLAATESQAVRYFGLLLIYLSSTADMFITGLGNSVVLPVVLALVSIAGVLAGILLRVRAFMFLGVSFLFLVVFSQIWHAAVDRAQTWVWWASGIVLGAAILTLFALFEKRRNDVLRVIEEIKGWR